MTCTKKRDILHITIGDEENGWIPTPSDLNELATTFMNATLSDDRTVIVTAHDVKCKVHSIEEGQHLRIVGAHVDAELLEHIRTTASPVTVLTSVNSDAVEIHVEAQPPIAE